jgi:hypothetical protein
VGDKEYVHYLSPAREGWLRYSQPRRFDLHHLVDYTASRGGQCSGGRAVDRSAIDCVEVSDEEIKWLSMG